MYEIGFAKLVSKYGVLAVFLVFAGFVRGLIELKKARENKIPFSPLDFTIAVILAIFVGIMFPLMSIAFGMDPDYIPVAIGVGAFLSVNGFNELIKILMKAVTARYSKND